MLSVAALNTAGLTVYPRNPTNTPITAHTTAASIVYPGIIITSITTVPISTYHHQGFRHTEAAAGEHHGRGCTTTTPRSRGTASQRHIQPAMYRIRICLRDTHPTTTPSKATAAYSGHNPHTHTRRPRWVMLLGIFRIMRMTYGTTRDTIHRQRDSWGPGSNPTRTCEGSLMSD